MLEKYKGTFMIIEVYYAGPANGMKVPHTKKKKLEIRGDIPDWLITRLKKEYGPNLIIKENSTSDENDFVEIFKTDWYSAVNSQMGVGDNLKIYRENAGLSQEELGKKLGNIPRQNISAMEKGRRGISKEIAKKLSIILKAPVSRFI
jgi:DNA-binding XRE family transcriptional regulator